MSNLSLGEGFTKKVVVLLDFVQITPSKQDSAKYLILYFNRPIRPDPTWPPTQYFFFNIRPDLILKIPSPWALVVRPFCQASNGKCDISLRSALLCLQRLNWNLRPNHGKQPFRTFPTSNWNRHGLVKLSKNRENFRCVSLCRCCYGLLTPSRNRSPVSFPKGTFMFIAYSNLILPFWALSYLNTFWTINGQITQFINYHIHDSPLLSIYVWHL